VFILENKSLKMFPRTSRPISMKLGKNHRWVKGIQVCFYIKGTDHLQRGDNQKIQK
jgi:hypothetical protein